MSSDYTFKGTDNRLDIDRSLLSFILFIFTFFGVVWLAVNGVASGTIYNIIIGTTVLSIVFLFMLFISNKKEWVELPFATDNYTSVFWFSIGRIVPYALLLISTLVGGGFLNGVLNRGAVFVPLTFGQAVGPQTFNVISTTVSPVWRYFVVVWTAGIQETFFANFSAIIIGFFVGRFIRKSASFFGKSEFDFGSNGNKWFDFTVALIISAIFFAFLHVNNNSYTTTQNYVWAAVFLTIMSLLVYYFNTLLVFAIGFHMSNNEIVMMTGKGGSIAAVTGALTTSWGWLILLFYILIHGYFLIGLFQGKGGEVLRKHEVGL